VGTDAAPFVETMMSVKQESVLQDSNSEGPLPDEQVHTPIVTLLPHREMARSTRSDPENAIAEQHKMTQQQS
jgi:hypothetical protein